MKFRKHLLILFFVSLNAIASSSGFDTANDGVDIGNSQFSCCGSNSLPMRNFYKAQGRDFLSLLVPQDSPPVFPTLELPNDIPQDVVFLNSNDEGWALGYQRNLNAAINLHKKIVSEGSRTVLWMSYLTGIGPSKNLAHRSEVTRYWKQMETDLEKVVINGRTRDVLLIPVLELWELGKAAYPYNINAGSCTYQRGWQNDAVHATSFGQYAVGILMATFLTCNDPRPVVDNAAFPASYKNWARTKAWNLLSSSYLPDHCR